MLSNLRTFFGLLWQPLSAIKQLHDRAPIGFSAGAAGLTTLLYSLVAAVMLDYAQGGGLMRVISAHSSRGGGGGFINPAVIGLVYQALMYAVMTVLFVAVVYAPFTILIANLFERRERLAVVLREEYAPVASCALASLAVALLVTLAPAIFIGWQSRWLQSESVVSYFILLVVIPLPIFAALMTMAVGTTFRIGWAAAAVTTLLSFLSLLGLSLLMQAATFICASPLLLLLLLFLLRDRVSGFLRGHRARESFKQNLEASTLNPADASAHYNIGLLYQQRGEFESADASFRRAIEIDPGDADSHYQLGRIAREQGKYGEAIEHFEQVIKLDPKHSQNEVWREIGLVYYSAGQYQDALAMLEKFIGYRPSDGQAHYWLGMTLNQMGQTSEALQQMKSCIESVKTAPAYKYRTERQWLHLAQNFLRERQ